MLAQGLKLHFLPFRSYGAVVRGQVVAAAVMKAGKQERHGARFVLNVRSFTIAGYWPLHPLQVRPVLRHRVYRDTSDHQ